jgi:hypothetical protein
MHHNSFTKTSLFLLGLLVVCAACQLPEKIPEINRKTISPVTEKSKIALPSPSQSVETTTPASSPALATTTQAPNPDIGALVFAYTNAQDLYLFLEGKITRLTNSRDIFEPRLSSDGELIAFLRPIDDIHLEIWCINRDGSDERKLVSIEDMDMIAGGVRDPSAVAVNPSMDYKWLPSSHTLAFTSQQVYQGPGTNFLNDLILVDADSGELTPLLLAGWGGQFTFSPDGSKIVISQPDKILLASFDGSGYQIALTYDPVTTYSEYKYVAAPVWSPDGEYLMVAIPPVNPLAIPTETTELWRLNTNGSPPELLGGVKAVPFIESEIRFSPDLRWITYLVGDMDSSLREIHIAASDGSGDKVVDQASPLIFQSWAPDSDSFVYALGTDQVNRIAGIEGEKYDLGPDFTGAHLVNWINESSFIFWTQFEDGFEIWLGNHNGGAIILDRTSENPPSISILK